MTTRDRCLLAAKRRFIEVEIPGFGTARIRNLSDGEQGRLEADTVADNQKVPGDGTRKWRARKILACLVEDDGTPTFSDSDLGIILAMDAAITEQLYDAITKHCESGITIEEQEKN